MPLDIEGSNGDIMNWIKTNYQFLIIILAVFFLFVYTMEKFTEMDRELGHIQVLTMMNKPL